MHIYKLLYYQYNLNISSLTIHKALKKNSNVIEEDFDCKNLCVNHEFKKICAND